MIKVNLLKNRGTNATAATQADFQTSFETSFDSTSSGSSGSTEGSPLAKIFIILLPTILLYAYETYNIDDLKTRANNEIQKLSTIEIEVRQNASTAELAKKLQDEINSLEDRVKKIKDISKVRLREIRIVDYIQNIIPDRVWLQSLNLVDGKAQINGSSLSDDQLNRFMESLEKKNYFKSVILLRAIEQKGPEGNVKVFDLTAEINDSE